MYISTNTDIRVHLYTFAHIFYTHSRKFTTFEYIRVHPQMWLNNDIL